MEPKIFIDLFYNMLKPFSTQFRADVAPTFLILALAWIGTTRAQRTSNFIRTIGPESSRHTATYYRFFAYSQWSLDLLGLGLLSLLRPFLGFHPVLRIIIDDTLLKHRGSHIFGASIFRDAVLSTQSHVVRRWGLNWVVLSLAFPHPHYYGEFICIPLTARLFLTDEWCKKTGKSYASPSELAVEMVLFFYHQGPSSLEWRLAGDAGYTNNHLMLLQLERLSFTGVLRSDAVLEQPVASRPYQGKGARPKYGLPYDKPSEILKQSDVPRKAVTFRSYQGAVEEREVLELEGTYRKLAKTRKLRFIFILPKKKKDKSRYLVTTDLLSPLSVILEDLVSRWSIEVGCREAKQWMGVEKSQSWVRNGIVC